MYALLKMVLLILMIIFSPYSYSRQTQNREEKELGASWQDALDNPDKIQELYDTYYFDIAATQKIHCLILDSTINQIDEHESNMQEQIEDASKDLWGNEYYDSHEEERERQEQDLLSKKNQMKKDFDKKFAITKQKLPHFLKLAKQYGLRPDTGCKNGNASKILSELDDRDYFTKNEFKELQDLQFEEEVTTDNSANISENVCTSYKENNFGPLLELQRSGICDISKALKELTEKYSAKKGYMDTHHYNNKHHDCEISVVKTVFEQTENDLNPSQYYNITVIHNKKGQSEEKESIIVKKLNIEDLKKFDDLGPFIEQP